MLDQAIERFDSDFYKIWEKHAYRNLEQLELGLAKFQFPQGNIPDEIVELKILVELSKIEKDKKAFIKHISRIQEILDGLATKKDFKNFHANNFIFHCRRSFNWLTSALLNQHLKYGQAFLNPSDKPEIKSELGIVQKFAIKKGVKNINRQVLSAININVVRFNAIQVESMPPITIGTISDVSEPSAMGSILGQRLDAEKYNQLKSQLPVTSAEEAAKYLSEQIYGNAFEFYYSQIATLYGTLIKIDKMARDLKKSPEEIKEYRTKLLSQFGLGDIDTPEGKILLNNIAQHLGFQDAEQLHQNYTGLYKESEFTKLKEKKQEFMAYANRQDVYKENDPLEKIKTTFKAEYARVLKKSKTDLANKNAAYATVICYSAIDYIGALEGLQKKKNVAKIVAQDIVDPRQQRSNVGFFEKLAVGFAFFAMENLNLKQRMDAVVLSNLYTEQAVYERRLQDATNETNILWLDHTKKERIKSHNQREKIFQKVDNLQENELIEKYVSKIQKYKKAWKEKSRSSLTEEEKSQQAQHFDKINATFITYRNAFDFKQNNQIFSMNATDLDNYIQNKQEQRKALLAQMQDKENILKDFVKLQNEQAAKVEKKPGFLERLFGKMPWQRSKQKKRQASLEVMQSKVDNFERLGLQLEIETDLLQKAIEQKALKARGENQDVTALREEINIFVSHYVTLQEHVQRDNEFLTMDQGAYQHHYALQKSLKIVENRLEIALTSLAKKINSAEEKTKIINQGSLATRDFLREFSAHKDKLGSNRQVDELLNVLIELNKQSTALQQDQLLSLAKNKVDSMLASDNMLNVDPFLQLQTEENDLLLTLSEENQTVLAEYMQNHFIDSLKSKADTLDRAALENLLIKMEYGFLLYSNKKSPTHQELTLTNNYQACILAAQNIIHGKYQQIKALDPDDQRATLAQLDADLSSMCNQIVDAKQKRELLQQSYDSWISNPFGMLYTTATLEAADYNIVARRKQFQFFSKEFLGVLDNFLKEAPNYYPTLSLDILNNHIARLRDQAQKLKELNKDFLEPDEKTLFTKLIDKHEMILECAISQENNHIEHPINAINLSLGILMQKNLHLHILQEKILQSLNASYQLNVTDLESYTDILAETQENILTIQAEFANLAAKDMSKNPNWPLQKNKIEEQIRNLQDEIAQKVELLKNTLSFFSKIQKGESLSPDVEIDPMHLGKGLVLAIEHKNTPAITTLIAKSSKINMHDLAVALQKAASNGNVELVTKLLDSRSDLTFTQTDLVSTIKAALEHKNLFVVQTILSKNNVEFDRELIELLTSSLPAETTLSPIERGWGQLLVDNDWMLLSQIRDCYRFLEQLSLLATEQNPQQKMQIEKIKDQMLTPLKGRYIENQERKNSQIEKWDKQLALLNNPQPAFEPAVENEISILPYLSSRNEKAPVDDLVDLPPRVLGSSRVLFNEALQYEQQSKNFLSTIKDKSWDKIAIQKELSELQHLTTETNKNMFFRTISEAVNTCALHNHLEPLQTILGFLEDSPNKNELSFNALRQAIEGNHDNIVAWLLEKNAHLGRTPEIEENLRVLYQKSKSSPQSGSTSRFNQVAFQILIHVSLPPNESTIDIMNKITDEAKSNRIPAVPKGAYQRFFSDTDGPHLEELRKGYLFCDNAFQKQTMAFYLRFRNPLDNKLLEKTPQEFSVQEQQELATQIQELKKVAEIQRMRILELKQQHLTFVQSHHEFQNRERMTGALAEWEQALTKMTKEFDNTIEQDIKHGEKILRECRQEPSHREVPTQRKTHRSNRPS